MRATIAHPVPVRWTPPRAQESRVAVDLAVTPVEIPEIPHRALESAEPSLYSLPGSGSRPAREATFHVHAGRCFERVHFGMLNVYSRGLPVADDVVGYLADAGMPEMGAHDVLARPGTPLCALENAHSGTGTRGSRLPDAIHARAVSDHTAQARASLLDWVRDNLVTDGEAVYVARSMPVLHLSSWNDGYVLERHPRGIADGVGFEPSRLDRLAAVTSRMAAIHGKHRTKHARAAEGLAAAFGKIPYADDDLAAFRNDGPEAVARLLALARQRGIPEDGLRAAASVSARLAPYADLGRIGAIPASQHAEVEDLVCEGLRALAGAVPEGMSLLRLRDLLAYAEGVIAPMRLAAPVPDEDGEALDGLAHGPRGR